MKTIYLFSKAEREELLKEYCKVNTYSYHMVCDVMYENLLGEEAAKDTMKQFKFFISGKLRINHNSINFE